MKAEEVSEAFIKFEMDEDWLSLKYRGVRIWAYLRQTIYADILSQKGAIGNIFTKLEQICPSCRFFAIRFIKLKMYQNFWNNPFRKIKKANLLFLNHPRRVKNTDGSYQCIVTDGVAKSQPLSNLVLEEPYWIDGPAYFTPHFTPTTTNNLAYLDYAETRFEILKALQQCILKHFISKNNFAQVTKIINKINIQFNVNLNPQKYYLLFEEFQLYEKCTNKFYDNIFRVVQPKALIEFYNPNRVRQQINRVAHANHVPIICLQHGIIFKDEPLMMNYETKSNMDHFPDWIFLFGEYWKTKAKFPISMDRLIPTGYPYFEEKQKSFKKETNSNTILFMSQGSIGFQLSKIAYQLSLLLFKTKYKIAFKTHPFEHNRWKADYPWLIQKNIEVIDDNEHDIYYYFNQASCLVGVNSTSLFEGMALGLTVFIYNIYGSNQLSELIDGYSSVRLFDKAEAIADFLDKEIPNDDSTVDLSEMLFMHNSMSNILQQVEFILG